MTVLSEIHDEFVHIGHLFSKEGSKLAHFLTPIISDMAKLVAADAEGDLPLAVDAVEAAVALGTHDPEALFGIALKSVQDVVKKQVLSVGEQAVKATAAAIVAQASPSTIPTVEPESTTTGN